MDRFSIHLDPGVSEDVGLPCGRIIVGGWDETFEVAPVVGETHPEASHEELWWHELRRLLDGAAAVTLRVGPGRAWVLYREGNDVFIQDHLFLVSDGDEEMVLDSREFAIPPRVTKGDDRDISEWRTNVHAIRSFLESAEM